MPTKKPANIRKTELPPIRPLTAANVEQHEAIKRVVQHLDELEKDRAAMRPTFAGRRREDYLREGLHQLFAFYGLTLAHKPYINSRGEFDLTVNEKAYGTEMGDFLHRYYTRSGILPSKMDESANRWCWANHFTVERMLRDFAAHRGRTHYMVVGSLASTSGDPAVACNRAVEYQARSRAHAVRRFTRELERKFREWKGRGQPVVTIHHIYQSASSIQQVQ